MTGLGPCGRTVFLRPLVLLYSVYFLSLNSTLRWSFTKCLNSWKFGEFKLGFHGHVGPCRICRLSTDIFLVVYLYVYTYIYGGRSANPCVAGCCCLSVSVLVLFLYLVRILGLK